MTDHRISRQNAVKHALFVTAMGEEFECVASTDHPQCSYGKAVWVDVNTGEAICQVGLPLPIGYTIERIWSDEQE